MMNNLPILTTVKDGQSYVDEPVYDTINLLPAVNPVRKALGLFTLTPVQMLIAYNHVKLRWMKPDGNGGVVPR